MRIHLPGIVPVTPNMLHRLNNGERLICIGDDTSPFGAIGEVYIVSTTTDGLPTVSVGDESKFLNQESCRDFAFYSKFASTKGVKEVFARFATLSKAARPVFTVNGLADQGDWAMPVDLTSADTHDMAGEIRRRGYLPIIWGAGDLEWLFEGDSIGDMWPDGEVTEDDVDHLSDADREAVLKVTFEALLVNRLEDSLTSNGNTVLENSMAWLDCKAAFKSAVMKVLKSG